MDLMSITSSQRNLLKHKQRHEAKQGKRLQIHADLSASQSTIKSSPSNMMIVHPSKRGVGHIQNISDEEEDEEDSEANTLLLPSSVKKAGKERRNVIPAQSQQDMDMSLGQLINSSMSMLASQPRKDQPGSKVSSLQKQKKVKNQEELMPTMSQKGLRQLDRPPGSNASIGGQISMEDAYGQLQNLKFDLQKIRQVHKDLGHQNSSDQDEDSSSDENNNHKGEPLSLHSRAQAPVYDKLIKPHSKDQPNVQLTEGGAKAEQGMSVFEINNKLISEGYAVSKRREYVQRHIGEVDIDILDTGNEQAAPLQAFSKAMQYIKKPLKMTAQDDEEDDSRSQNDGDHEFSGINIQLLTDDKRLNVSIPSYDTHYRLYFENPDGFRQQVQQHQTGNQKPTHGSKVHEERQETLEQTCKGYFSRLSDSEQIDFIGKMVPSFGSTLRDLQQMRLKYWLLLDRIKKYAPPPVKNMIVADKQCEVSGVSRDFKLNYHASNPLQMPNLVHQVTKDQQQQRRKGTFGDPNLTNNSLQQPNNVNKKEESQRAVNSGGDVQRIKEQLGDAESKLKDAQLQRLQEKVKGFAATEKQLRLQVMEVEKRDESLVTKIENAVCFGKVVITSRPLIVQEFGDLLSEIKYHALDVHLQKQQILNFNLEEKQGEPTLAERIDDSIAVKLEVEFNELYNILRSPSTLKEAGFSSRFGLVTPEQNFHLFSDLYMTQELATLNLAHSDFFDMGILLQNNKESKRMMFYKLVHHNLRERKREVYLMSVFEDQVAKWENCLDSSDEIKAHDRTFKLIKDKLLRAMIERERLFQRQTDSALQGGDAVGHLDYENWEEHPSGMLDDEDFQKMKDTAAHQHKHMLKPKNSLLASSDDEEEYSVYQRRYDDHVTQQTRKLMEVGLDPTSAAAGNLDYVQSSKYIGRTEDLQKELTNISQTVQLRVKSKMQAEQEKEDKERQVEQQKRQRAKEAQNQEYAKAIKALTLGTTFLKYGAMGPPKQRHVFLQENGKKLCWKDPGATSTSGSRFIVVKEILKIEEGRDTKKFKRFKTESNVQESLSFSIHTKKRTLDLEAANLLDKVAFINSLEILLKQTNQLEGAGKRSGSNSGPNAGAKDELNESS